jgi:hypothetical protein
MDGVAAVGAEAFLEGISKRAEQKLDGLPLFVDEAHWEPPGFRI